MLNAREALKEELQMKSIVTSGLEVYNWNSFQVSKKEADGGRDATEVPSSVWMKTIREICGHIRSHADSSRSEGRSNCYMTLRRLWDSYLALALLTRFIFGFGACSDVLYTCTLSFPVHPKTVTCALHLVSRVLSTCSQHSTSRSLVSSTFL